MVLAIRVESVHGVPVYRVKRQPTLYTIGRTFQHLKTRLIGSYLT